MFSRKLLIASLALAALGSTLSSPADARPGPLCPSAKYLASPRPLVPGFTSDEDSLVVVQGKEVSIGSLCPPAKAVLRARGDGSTRIVARWPSCRTRGLRRRCSRRSA